MIRGTTPDYILTVSDFDLTDKTVYVTMSQHDETMITLTGDRLSIAYENGASTIHFSLTQMETFRFRNGTIDIQVRFIDSNDVAYATEIKTVAAERVLLNEVIGYVEQI
ncbi:MAG: hypothetical protein IJT28_08100 [Bacteroidaceae bacterium]|nr:hypothetical protein [Bacteroidaceae bacterium]